MASDKNILEIKIYYEDTDSGGVVYYANYLKYMERGRTEYLADRGISVKGLMDQGTIFMVSRAEIDYKASAHYGETIILETTVAETTGATLLFRHRISEKLSNRLLVEGTIRMVCTDLSGKPKRTPREMAERIPTGKERVQVRIVPTIKSHRLFKNRSHILLRTDRLSFHEMVFPVKRSL